MKRGGLGLPNLQAYFEAAGMVWLKDWILLGKKELLNLEGYDLIFGWHAYLWYNKYKANKQFDNHFFRKSIRKIWEKYKMSTLFKTPGWISPHEACTLRPNVGNVEYKRYSELLKKEKGDVKLKERHEIVINGEQCQWYVYLQLNEKYKQDAKKGFYLEQDELWVNLCKDERGMIRRVYTLLLMQITETERVKKNMIIWAEAVRRNIYLEQRDQIWKKNIKFTKNINLRENVIKMFYRWHLCPTKIAKMYPNMSDMCWRCHKECTKIIEFWEKIQEILGYTWKRKKETYLLNITDLEIKVEHRKLFFI
ncbi:uncharacterized protein LOC125439767 [Sphaerodactylus townsendi]|uniref:uncharacterized protein LOC125439767 n=1 Tax=Sphaerodactylus townsendi TaxID=933632 RepID=UPI002025B686|nr:uncharacterized protein LOC125439767 [Sphaerodactylus townsendi]